MRRERGRTILKRFRLAVLCFLIFLTLLSSQILLAVTQGGDYHDDHLNDPTDAFPNDYAPMVIPFNGKKVTVAPVITCTTLEDVFKPHHYPCKLAQTLFVDDEWSDKDADYTYMFEDWTDYDWNDIVVSLYASTNDIIDIEIRLEEREAVWKNPFSVEITPESLTVDVHWNSTDYPENHVVRVNPNDTVDIELFAESNPGDTAFVTIIPIIPPAYWLTITSTSGGTTNPIPGNYTYPEDTHISVTAIAFTDYFFDHWELDSENVGSGNPLNMTMDANHTLHAVFMQITYTLTISVSGEGTTDPAKGSHVYGSGSTVAVSATADPGWYFDHWVLDGENAGSTIPINVLMNSNHDLKTVFAQVTYTLTITTTTGGTTSPAPGYHVYSSGTDVLVTATPQENYEFDHWVLDGSNASSDNLISVTMDENHTLHAVFVWGWPEQEPPVGGHAIPIDKTHFLAPKTDLIPGISLAFVLLAAMAVTIILIRRRNKTLKWGH